MTIEPEDSISNVTCTYDINSSFDSVIYSLLWNYEGDVSGLIATFTTSFSYSKSNADLIKNVNQTILDLTQKTYTFSETIDVSIPWLDRITSVSDTATLNVSNGQVIEISVSKA